ncbi:unnamed protein product [Acanthoscelides obtectus]|nr:unnamed protein product [Acanthoscelides obtectus]CAK1631232.1 Eukaryotic translation initiation factor 3 subunit F-1 [Acanthoscelides obtectus]
MDVYDLNRRVNSNEAIVGWWATGHEVTNHSAVIHEYYSRECNNPVHVTVDTSLQNGRMGLKAYVCVPLGVPNGKPGCMFTSIPIDITCYDPEVFGLHLCEKTMTVGRLRTVSPMQDLNQVAEAGTKMTILLDQVLAYVEDVLANRVAPNNAVGRSLLDLVNSVPHMTNEQFSEMFNSNVKDLLMVVTLSQLIKTQLQFNEKLTLLTSI